MGRKSKYESHVKPHLKDISKWYGDMTEKQIAKKLGVSVQSFEDYKKRYPELVESLKKGKETLSEDLKSVLKKKAKGYFYTETKIIIKKENGKDVKTVEKYEKYAHPDTGAIHLLLKNNDPTWRNDDQTTVDLKKEQLKIAREKMESNTW